MAIGTLLIDVLSMPHTIARIERKWRSGAKKRRTGAGGRVIRKCQFGRRHQDRGASFWQKGCGRESAPVYPYGVRPLARVDSICRSRRGRHEGNPAGKVGVVHGQHDLLGLLPSDSPCRSARSSSDRARCNSSRLHSRRPIEASGSTDPSAAIEGIASPAQCLQDFEQVRS